MRWLGIITALFTLLAIALGGSAPFGRVFLAIGQPGIASHFFKDPSWQGVAHFRAGKMILAAEDFESAGDFYNLGNAQTQNGLYASALEAFDLAIASGDQDARVNFDLVAAFYSGLAVDPDALGLIPARGDGPTEDSFIARGDARAAGTGDEATNVNTMLGLAAVDSTGRLGVRRVFDDKFMVADDRWLQQLADVPGEYLKARIAFEAKARAAAGLALPAPEDPL